MKLLNLEELLSGKSLKLGENEKMPFDLPYCNL